MSTPMQDFVKTYTSQIETLYKQLEETENESLFWRCAFSFLIGYTHRSKGIEFGSMKEYQESILALFEENNSANLKRRSK